jgi:hypothetical protein
VLPQQFQEHPLITLAVAVAETIILLLLHQAQVA